MDRFGGLYPSAVNSQVQTSLSRLRKYLERVERDLASGDHGGALSSLAELGEIARRLLRRNPLRSGMRESFASLRLLAGALGVRSPTGRSLNDVL